MAKIETHGSLQAGRTPVNGCSVSAESGTGQIRDSLSSDNPPATPNFLDILSDCVDNVDFQLKCDQIAHSEEPTSSGMSQKKCLFCS